MAAGRPHGPNDPGLMSSLETAVTEVRRPGPAELTWNWRWELGIPNGRGLLRKPGHLPVTWRAMVPATLNLKGEAALTFGMTGLNAFLRLRLPRPRPRGV
jgi:hypothetical protein